MASKMANWVAYQQWHLSPEAFDRWVAGNVKVRSFLDKQNRVPAVLRALDDLQRDILKKVMAPALERASNFLATSEKSAAAGLSKTGLLEKSIGSIKPKIYPATFCGYVASGPRRGFARAEMPQVDKKGNVTTKALSKRRTLDAAIASLATAATPIIVNPVAYAQFLRHGRKSVKAGQTGSGKRALVSPISGKFFGHQVVPASPRNFMANAEALKDSAANIATEEMNLQLQKLLPGD